MRVLVCGGRNYDDSAFVFWALDSLHARKPIELIIHGGAQGSDTFAEQWSLSREVTHFCVPADWHRYGSRAGSIRNKQMLDFGKPDLVVAFTGGNGTRDMTSQAVIGNVRVLFAEKLKPHYDAEKATRVDTKPGAQV